MSGSPSFISNKNLLLRVGAESLGESLFNYPKILNFWKAQVLTHHSFKYYHGWYLYNEYALRYPH